MKTLIMGWVSSSKVRTIMCRSMHSILVQKEMKKERERERERNSTNIAITKNIYRDSYILLSQEPSDYFLIKAFYT
jgi:hypothetical protein